MSENIDTHDLLCRVQRLEFHSGLRDTPGPYGCPVLVFPDEREQEEDDAASLAYQANEATIQACISAMGGEVEGRPTGRHNFLQRIRALRNEEQNALYARSQLQEILEWHKGDSAELLKVALNRLLESISDTDES